MGKLTSKGRGRPRKALHDAGLAKQAAISASNDHGHGQNISGGVEAPAVTGRENERLGGRFIVNGIVFDAMQAASYYMASL